MHTGKKHIIQKVFLEVETGSLKTAHYLREHLDTFLKDEIFPMLETYFNTVQMPGGTVAIQTEKLHMVLNVEEQHLREKKFNGLKRIFQEQIAKETEKLSLPYQQAQDHNNGNVRPLSPERRQYNTFFHFIKTGRSPWWASAKDMNILSDPANIPSLILQKGFAGDLGDVLRERIPLKRLIRQFPDNILIPLFIRYVESVPSFLTLYSQVLRESEKKTVPNGSTLYNSPGKAAKIFAAYLKRRAQRYKEGQKEHFWSLVTTMVLSASATALQSSMTALSAFLADIKEIENTTGLFPGASNKIPGNLPDISFSRSSPDQGERVVLSDQKESCQPGYPEETGFPAEATEKEIFIENTGLILLHPFLKPFLLDCGLIGPDNVFSDKELAAHLLHYTATGKEMDTENFMLLEKFLCDIPLQEPVARERPLTGQHKEKSLELLASVTGQWKAFKNTSAVTIRNEFIQRPGKLITGRDNPRIIVERKTQDILLEKLPWNISIVKIPWIEKLIFVEW
ncbi:hypothetical protein ED312_04195 [Sinomicrobium pectinilyticum]|uniref:Uncharacterized protein n=1 Tax=Sinomicrobium pectinilyticum TaxID=1084421 RepID=A0A3N0EVH7_SINP1|nr:contractile injection system tape measure protein [Sinomicrobium pectinilyticum]RNL91727.1 hypothetical protein ED312_04195 [Sinomicrobium pectinilyticum]